MRAAQEMCTHINFTTVFNPEEAIPPSLLKPDDLFATLDNMSVEMVG